MMMNNATKRSKKEQRKNKQQERIRRTTKRTKSADDKDYEHEAYCFQEYLLPLSAHTINNVAIVFVSLVNTVTA